MNSISTYVEKIISDKHKGFVCIFDRDIGRRYASKRTVDIERIKSWVGNDFY